MRSLLLAVLLVMFSVPSSHAVERYLPVAGSVGVFRTDARLFNPSFTDDIEVVATFLPGGNVSNAGRTGVTISIPKRQMRVFNDVVATLFNATGLGAIRLVSEDDFAVTARVYAQSTQGTLGLFMAGQDPAANGVSRGILLHLKGADGFRANIGLVNPGSEPVTVRVQLFDRNNAAANSPEPIVVPPLGVISPTNVASGFFGSVGSADLSDGWAYVTTTEADARVLAYASVVDNQTTDPVFIPAIIDTAPEPPAQVTRTFEVDAKQFDFDIRPGGSITADVGDLVVLRIRSLDVTHGFSMPPFVPNLTLGTAVTEVKFEVTQAGTFPYFCTVSTCGEGHFLMTGNMTVRPRE